MEDAVRKAMPLGIQVYFSVSFEVIWPPSASSELNLWESRSLWEIYAFSKASVGMVENCLPEKQRNTHVPFTQ